MNTSLGFMPSAASSVVNPGQYQATCTEVHPPAIYRAFNRWYMRVDFAIHDDGSIVSQYINLGNGTHPNTQLGSRSGYWRSWTAAVGRNPKKGEPMDPAMMLGAEVTVTVVIKERHGGGEYSVVSEVTAAEPERLSVGESSLNAHCSLLNAQNSTLNTQDSTLDTQALSSSSSQANYQKDESVHRFVEAFGKRKLSKLTDPHEVISPLTQVSSVCAASEEQAKAEIGQMCALDYFNYVGPMKVYRAGLNWKPGIGSFVEFNTEERISLESAKLRVEGLAV